MAPKTATKGAKKAVTKTKAVRTGDKKHRRRRRGEVRYLHLQGSEADVSDEIIPIHGRFLETASVAR